MGRRVYSDAERAAALTKLKLAGWKPGETVTAAMARKVGVPRQTLTRWASGEVKACQTPDVGQLEKAAERTLLELFESEIRAAFKAADGKRDRAQYRDLAWAIGVFTDKTQLLSGQATERVEHIDMTPEEALDVLRQVRQSERRNGHGG